MAQLAALYDEKNDWDVFVVEGLHRGVLNPTKNRTDVLGRTLPRWAGARVLNSIKASDAVKLAKHLIGLPKERRQSLFEEQAEVASVTYFGTQA
jgi:type IV secretory pathway protease TraF